jgi:ferredoxin
MGSSAVLDAQKKPSATFATQLIDGGQRLATSRRTEDTHEQPVMHDFGDVSLNQTGAQTCTVAAPRTCPFGGACHTCPTRVQAKLEVGQPDDEYEREADEVAERVMRMPEPCCSGRPNEDEKEKIHLKPLSPSSAGIEVSPEVEAQIQSLRTSGGRPLSDSERTFFEPRFDRDFGRVRVHSDFRAAQTARAMGAKAFTVGQDVVLGAGHAATPELGNVLMAHELAHVGQQVSTLSPQLRRKLAVDPKKGKLMKPLPYPYSAAHAGDEEEVKLEYAKTCLKTLDADRVGVDVDSTGKVTTSRCTKRRRCSSTRKGERATDHCLCDMTKAIAKKWTLVVDDYAWPSTDFSSTTISINSAGSVFQQGEWSATGNRFAPGDARILGHELCGHAWLKACGVDPQAKDVGMLEGRPAHDPTVMIENKIASEMAAAHGTEYVPRGLYADPHAGESYMRVAVEDFRAGDHQVPRSEDEKLRDVATFLTGDMSLSADIVGHGDDPAGTSRDERRPGDRAVTRKQPATEGHGEPRSAIVHRDNPSLAYARATEVGNVLTARVFGKQIKSVRRVTDPPYMCVEIFMFHYVPASQYYAGAGKMLPSTEAQMDEDKRRVLKKLGYVMKEQVDDTEGE